MTLILSEADVEQCLTMDACLESLELTFRDFGAGEAVSRPRTHTYSRIDEKTFYNFKSMDGGVPRYGVHAIRLSSEVVRETESFGRRREEKLALARGGRYVGLVLLFDMKTTEPLAIIQDAGLQRLRVGATSALAAKFLSRQDSRTVGLFGSGWQADPQLQGLVRVRNINRVKVYSPDSEHRKDFARRMTENLGVEVVSVANAREVVTDSDIVICATNSLDPVFDGDWLESGQHVNSLQAGELDRTTHDRADLIAVRARGVSRTYIQENSPNLPGNLKKLRKYNRGYEDKMVELGKVMAGQEQGRMGDSQITLFGGGGTGPSSGLGIQFAAVGWVAYQEAEKKGLGHEIPTEWLLEAHHP